MLCENVKFIRHPAPFNPAFRLKNPAPLFRRHFTVRAGLLEAVLSVTALGVGEYYINGRSVTADRFTAPISDYRKTLWVTEYDVTRLLTEGENVAAVALGNGYFNESLHTPWDFDTAEWRDSPKLALRLVLTYADGTETVETDEEWLCNRSLSPWRFNELRYGEIFDSRFDTDWYFADYDDSSWENAVLADNPGGTFRLCPAPPIREKEVYECVKLFQNKAGAWVFDFGQNLSGYPRVTVREGAGTKLVFTYAEQLNEDGTRRDNGLPRYYHDGIPATSTLICNGEPLVWKPTFSYYGYRFVIVEGYTAPPFAGDMQSVFVHQDVKITGNFHCSDETLNKLYDFSRISTLSNLFYMPTDCPTREKLGWCNDAQASVEQMVQNYDMVGFYTKWMQDIADAQTADGNLPGIVPTGGWGFGKWAGPVSTGVFFEIPARIYQYTGDTSLLRFAYPTMCRHLDWLEQQRNEATGLICTGLSDWAGPFEGDTVTTPQDLVVSLVTVKMYRYAELAAEHSGDTEGAKALKERENTLASLILSTYVKDGKCTVQTQSAVAMLIALGLYDDIAPLKAQLEETLPAHDWHFHVGMVGMQYILPALDKCGLYEEAYRLMTADGYPGYKNWFADDATTLFEMWHNHASCNHHMYSGLISWLHNTVLGLKQDAKLFTEHTVTVAPVFLSALTHAEGCFDTAAGQFAIAWKRTADGVKLSVSVPFGVTAKIVLPCGEQTLCGRNAEFLI